MSVQVDQPLCIECSRDVVKQVDESIREAEDDIAAYQAALDSLQQENLQPMSSEVLMPQAQPAAMQARAGVRLLIPVSYS